MSHDLGEAIDEFNAVANDIADKLIAMRSRHRELVAALRDISDKAVTGQQARNMADNALKADARANQ